MIHILVAEDEPLFLKVIERLLINNGYEVTCATNGQEALFALEKNEFNLIITDILMPFISGLELIGSVRSNAMHAGIPILVLSALGQENTVMEAFQLGADDFVTKPFNALEFNVRVKRLANRKL